MYQRYAEARRWKVEVVDRDGNALDRDALLADEEHDHGHGHDDGHHHGPDESDDPSSPDATDEQDT